MIVAAWRLLKRRPIGVLRYRLIPELFAIFVVAPLTYMVTDRTPPFQLYDGTITPNPVRRASTVIHQAQSHIAPGARSADGYAKLGVALIDDHGRPRPQAEIIADTVKAIDALPPDERVKAVQTVGGVAVVSWKARFLRTSAPDITLFGMTLSSRFCPGRTQRELVDSQQQLWPYLVRNRAGIFHPTAGNSNVGDLSTPVLNVPEQMDAGTATYHVTNFYYCNALQETLDWPIITGTPVSSQDITFRITSQ